MRMMDSSSSPSRQSSCDEPNSAVLSTAGVAPSNASASPVVGGSCPGAVGGSSPSSASSQAGSGGTFHFKILVPSVAAGAIIGKGGETIAALQKECGARVKMSKSNDFYPGTSERVCLITGSVEGIIRIHNFVMDKIKEKPDPNARIAIDFDHKQTAEREKQVKILVPNSTAGMIIGKGGNYIKQIKEESGAYVQLSQKSRDHALAERSITVIGEEEPARKAVELVLAKIVEDPQSGSCLNVSYAEMQGPVANFNPTGSPYANPASIAAAGSLSTLSGSGVHQQTPSGRAATGYNSNGSRNSPTAQLQHHYPAPFTAGAQGGHPMTNQLDGMKLALRQQGYGEQATSEITAAISVLASHGVLGSLGQLLSSQTVNLASLAHSMYSTTTDPAPALYGPIGSLSGFATPTTGRPVLDAAISSPFDAFRRTVRTPPIGTPPPGSPQGTPGAPQTPQQIINNNSFGLATGAVGRAQLASTLLAGATPRKSPSPGFVAEAARGGLVDTIQKDIEVGENIVGAILGPGGKSLVDIQRQSGALIQISKKGVFAPGTRNRIVTITGSPNSVATAQYLIQQHVGEEEAKRAQNLTSAVHR